MKRYKQTKAAILSALDDGPLWTEEIIARVDAPRICIRFAL